MSMLVLTLLGFIYGPPGKDQHRLILASIDFVSSIHFVYLRHRVAIRSGCVTVSLLSLLNLVKRKGVNHFYHEVCANAEKSAYV